MIRINNFKWLPKDGAIKKAFNYFQPAVRYTLDDIMELPAAYVPPPIQTELSAEQKRVYDGLRKHATALIAKGEVNAMNAGVLMSKLLQVSCGWIYDSKRNIYNLDGGARPASARRILSTARRVRSSSL
jgi:hypothetical protein